MKTKFKHFTLVAVIIALILSVTIVPASAAEKVQNGKTFSVKTSYLTSSSSITLTNTSFKYSTAEYPKYKATIYITNLETGKRYTKYYDVYTIQSAHKKGNSITISLPDKKFHRSKYTVMVKWSSNIQFTRSYKNASTY